jgi:hypothetical protein
MKKLFRHVSGYIFIFLIFNALWELCSFPQLPKAWETIIELFIGPLTLLSGFLWFLFRVLWKIPVINTILRPCFAINPYLQGTWKGSLKYEWEQKHSEKEVFLVIIQADAFTIHCRLFTDEKESESLQATLSEYNGRWALMYQYQTLESFERRRENPVHTGTTVLYLDDTLKPWTLRGHYYTFRNTSGELEFKKVSSKLAKSYNSAQSICCKPTP